MATTASGASPAGPSHQIGTDPVAARPAALRSHSRRAEPLLVAPDPAAAAAAATRGGGERREGAWICSGSERGNRKEELEPPEPPLPEPPFATRGGSPSMPLSLSYCQYHRAAESMAQAQPNLLAGRARLRRPPTGDFKREARSHWPPRAFTPRQACSAESWSGIGGARGAEKQEGVKRRGPGLGEAPGTRMQPRAWAPGLPLPPGRLKWATAASARPERSTTGAPEAGASARRDPVDSERLHRGFRGPQCPGTSGFSPQSPHSARDPELPGALCSHGPGSPPKNPPVAFAQPVGGQATGWTLTWSP